MPAQSCSSAISIAKAAYEAAGIDPKDVNVAEVYDLSTALLELDWYENIGLCGTGEAVKLLRDGATTIGGRVPVNPSGGLACFGEAVPAQAIAQVCELTWHLRGQAGERQVQGAKVGITANQGLFGHGSSVSHRNDKYLEKRGLGDILTQSGSTSALQAEVDALRWFHQIDFGDGVLSPGWIKKAKVERVAKMLFTMPVAGKTVLDIGCWDGAYSVEATRLGARRVLATDHFAWSDQCWGDRRAFELTRSRLAPSIEVMDIDIPDLSVERVGMFDIVLFLGVFYHLRYPLETLERVAALAGNAWCWRRTCCAR